MACSRRDTILLAAEKGIGALTFAFIDPEEAVDLPLEYDHLGELLRKVLPELGEPYNSMQGDFADVRGILDELDRSCARLMAEETPPPIAPADIICVSMVNGNTSAIAASGMVPSRPI